MAREGDAFFLSTKEVAFAKGRVATSEAAAIRPAERCSGFSPPDFLQRLRRSAQDRRPARALPGFPEGCGGRVRRDNRYLKMSESRRRESFLPRREAV